MVHVEEPIDMLRVAHHLGVKQPAAIKLVWLDEFLLLGLNVNDLFDAEAELLIFQVEDLNWLTIVTHLNAGEESGVRLYRCLDGATQAVGIEAAVKDKEKRQIVVNLVFMAYAFRIDAVL